ncbi:hypothetical protein ACPXB5_32550 [Micromonospora arida]|uniref:hypothetical protein n=1 Tax=Micromonospora arida TaxID=2203715 RepID=UPI003CEED46A
MDDGLLRRLRAEQARALLDDADPHHAVMLACDLLVAGVDGDAVVVLVAADTCERILDGSARRCGVVTISVPWRVFVTLVRQTARYG